MKVLVAIFSFLISVRWCSGNVPENIECGRKYPQEERTSDGAIVQQSNNHPWLVALIYRLELFGVRKEHFICGGALVHEKYILTAAHCLDAPWFTKFFGEFVVKLGMHNLNSTSDGVERHIKKTIIHEHFVGISKPNLRLINDIALLELAEPVIFTPRIGRICLPEYEKNFAGVSAYFHGWGTNSTQDPFQLPGFSRRTDFLVIPHEAIDTSPRIHMPITEFIALHQEGRSFCRGDSGSPMILEEDGRATIIGISSWAHLCSLNPKSGSVSTNVTNYVRWIEANMYKPESIAES